METEKYRHKRKKWSKDILLQVIIGIMNLLRFSELKWVARYIFFDKLLIKLLIEYSNEAAESPFSLRKN